MKTIILASNNKHKIQEFREMLKNVQVLSLEDINFVEDIEENGKTLSDMKEEESTTYVSVVCDSLSYFS